MGRSKIDFSRFISLQPFWAAEKLKKQIIISSETGRESAIVYDLCCDKSVLDCVPGIGLIGIIFSEDPQVPRTMCFGTLDAPKKVPLFGMKKSLMCHFFPGEFARIFGIPCNVLTNKEIPLDDLIAVGPIAKEILEADSFETRVNSVRQLIKTYEHRTKASDTHLLAQGLMGEILQKNGGVRVRELEESTGYSARYLQRILSENVGLSPKVVSENVRFQNVLRMMYENPQLSLTEMAHQGGFYDQAHFSKVFKKYVELSPSVFLENIKAF